MNRKDMLGFQIKTLDNLFFRNMFAYETGQKGMDEVTVMHGWILRYISEGYRDRIFHCKIYGYKHREADGEKGIYLQGICGKRRPFEKTGSDGKRPEHS